MQDKKSQTNNSLPKGQTFSKKFIAVLISGFIMLMALIIYLVFNYDQKKNTKVEGQNINSDLSSQEILALSSKRVPVFANGDHIVKLSEHNYSINHSSDLRGAAKFIYKNGKLYQIGEDGKLRRYHGKLQAGDIVTKNNKDYFVGSDGQLHPLHTNQPQYSLGDIVAKDGKLYKVLADGTLQEYNGDLKEGDTVWQDGYKYTVDANGNLKPVDSYINPKYKAGDYVSQNGKLYKVLEDGTLQQYNGDLKEGDTVWQDGQKYVVDANGKLKAVSSNLTPQYRQGDFVAKDGKLYQVGKDGKLYEYNGKLQQGDIVYKDGQAHLVQADGKLHKLKDNQIFIGRDGKPYIFKDNQILPLSAQGATSGDFIEIDGQLYQIADDGTVKPYTGKLKYGDNVWQNGKLHYVDQAGQLHALEDGKIVLGKDGQLYLAQNGKLVTYNQPCFTQLINGQWYISDKQGKLRPFKEGDQCISENGDIVKLKDNQIIKIPSKKLSTTADFTGSLEEQWLNDIANTTDPKILSAPLHNFKPEQQAKAKDNSNAINQNDNGFKAPVVNQPNPYAMQNAQDQKINFLKRAKDTDHSDLKNTASMNTYPYSLTVGSIIPATLITGINSDLPGQIIAQVSRNIYDSKTGKYLLIPQGTKLIGIYSSQITYGQSRVLMAWNRLEFPNGYRYNLEGMQGADLSGYAGIADQVDHHYFRIFSSALLFSVFGAISQITQPKQYNGVQTPESIVYSAIGQQMTQVSSNQIEKNMDIQPTIKIRPGNNFNILVSRTMVFDNSYKYGELHG
ncbi:TrbI/VirB10 family protein [Francisella sp. TX07-6608]|uniref:TrbI/VirB10 family protein n=1 Tax=Francisella sp. TX07-6608 TaxID=573568 RepID=UPI001314B2F8|nr:TrbI/VirB10 family protein [Francisella sp. TX07-6608]